MEGQENFYGVERRPVVPVHRSVYTCECVCESM